MGPDRAWGMLGAALVLGPLACSLGVGDDGGLGTASLGSSATAGNTEGMTSTSAGTDDDGTDGSVSMSASDPSGSADPSGPDDTSGPGTDTDDPPGGEVCNGLDDDGDGNVDEDVPDVSCGLGICEVTVAGCEGGVPAQCFPGSAGTESCNGLDDDCDGQSDEELTQACDSNCGPGTQSCSAGVWGQCDAPPPMAEDCDVADDDCNGAVDDGVAGCRVDIHRWYHPETGEHFYTTDANEGFCCGFQLELTGFFELYAAAHPQLTAFYRCVAPGGFHHYTTDAACEGLNSEGVIGYIGTVQLPGSTQLYRSYSPVNGDHFFTTSLAEHNGAVGNGFTDEGVVGWVW